MLAVIMQQPIIQTRKEEVKVYLAPNCRILFTVFTPQNFSLTSTPSAHTAATPTNMCFLLLPCFLRLKNRHKAYKGLKVFLLQSRGGWVRIVVWVETRRERINMPRKTDCCSAVSIKLKQHALKNERRKANECWYTTRKGKRRRANNKATMNERNLLWILLFSEDNFSTIVLSMEFEANGNDVKSHEWNRLSSLIISTPSGLPWQFSSRK